MSVSEDRPLTGVRVLDLTRVLAGPFCSMLLADLGATVIKLERPGRGDDTRTWGPPFRNGMSAYFAAVNRNSRSLTLDINQPAGREILEQLVRESDVLLENFRSGTVAKLGVAPEQLRQINPRLVVCSISGFGRTGPWNELPGYDIVLQAMSGLMAITGDAEGEPMRVGVALSDVLTGLHAAVSVLAGLLRRDRLATERERSGDEPEQSSFCHIDVALLDCTIASLVNVAQSCLMTGEPPGRYGNAHAQIVPYQSFQTSDGHLVLAVGNDDQWRRFCRSAGRADLEQDDRFFTNPSRVNHRAELVRELAEEFRGRTTTEWIRLLRAAGIPHAPVLSVDQVLSHPQVQARNMVFQTADGLKMLRGPIKINGQDAIDPSPAPELGQHTAQILGELGYSDAQINQLHGEGVV